MQFHRYLLPVTTALIIAGCDQPSQATDTTTERTQTSSTSGSATATNHNSGSSVNLKSESSRFSYAVGMNFANSLAQFPVALDREALLAAVTTTIEHGKTAMTPKEAQQTIQSVIKKQQEKSMFRRKAQGEKNRKAGSEFLAENAKREGVHTTASGLQYITLREGDGESPKASDTVKVNYKGTLLDGTVFDSSYDRGEPISFPLNGVIKGWTEGLQLTKVGGKIRLFIPADLAY
ncbi:MAG: FKBP-type peptidyl-prolyl cis-trans isomerase, partial [Mariprofundales bacterium]|nr:FKBP-type peptidyl-prolyl cis-trans isomerase [Mariprofundales bacterium]